MSYADTLNSRMFDFREHYDMMAMELPDGARIVEVGTASGASGLYLAERLRAQGKTFTLYLIDSLSYGGVNQLTEIIRNVQKSGLGEYIEVWPLESLAASCKFNDNSLHYCFLDSSHEYPATKAEILLWSRKVMYGHKISGHDFNEQEGKGVLDAVNELVPRTIHNPETDISEPLLEVINTSAGLGIWSFTKRYYMTFKM